MCVRVDRRNIARIVDDDCMTAVPLLHSLGGFWDRTRLARCCSCLRCCSVASLPSASARSSDRSPSPTSSVPMRDECSEPSRIIPPAGCWPPCCLRWLHIFNMHLAAWHRGKSLEGLEPCPGPLIESVCWHFSVAASRGCIDGLLSPEHRLLAIALGTAGLWCMPRVSWLDRLRASWSNGLRRREGIDGVTVSCVYRNIPGIFVYWRIREWSGVWLHRGRHGGRFGCTYRLYRVAAIGPLTDADHVATITLAHKPNALYPVRPTPSTVPHRSHRATQTRTCASAYVRDES